VKGRSINLAAARTLVDDEDDGPSPAFGSLAVLGVAYAGDEGVDGVDAESDAGERVDGTAADVAGSHAGRCGYGDGFGASLLVLVPEGGDDFAEEDRFSGSCARY
jgi:hypothetical protein